MKRTYGRMMLPAIILMLAVGCGDALAQRPAPAGMSLATAAARRFPQPVRVGDLIGRTVLQPTESRPVLGHVKQVVRSSDGTVRVVVAYGGLFGVGARAIAVPADAMALNGTDLDILDFAPKQLSGFPTFDAVGTAPLAHDDTIHMGLARPSH